MRTKTTLLIFTVVLSVLFTFNSCVDKDKYKKELSQLDSMLHDLSAIEQGMKQIDSTRSLTPVQHVSNDLHRMDTLLPDTLKDKELAVLLMEYRSVINPLKQYPVKVVELRKTVLETQKRLEDLKNDLTKQIADEKQVTLFMETEKKNTLNIAASYTLLNSVLDNNIKKTDSLDPIIKGRIRELEILKSQKKK